ncbi:hypothetical protein LPB72_16655 [Hydrogenophaga crassostreae]|uniref:Uncharacterized protein n=1 Tax=Hydrogenophaga crassostreae TaxID=1763535 RepID=A0A162P2Q4_9BURK|nr:hypothetical protein LPB072_07170 [Hydrogenophaga crassostreae]OAD40530.1 hypothetical protein LPB72_16655 [Hydrogenophaga crassostreae]
MIGKKGRVFGIVIRIAAAHPEEFQNPFPSMRLDLGGDLDKQIDSFSQADTADANHQFSSTQRHFERTCCFLTCMKAEARGEVNCLWDLAATLWKHEGIFEHTARKALHRVIFCQPGGKYRDRSPCLAFEKLFSRHGVGRKLMDEQGAWNACQSERAAECTGLYAVKNCELNRVPLSQFINNKLGCLLIVLCAGYQIGFIGFELEVCEQSALAQQEQYCIVGTIEVPKNVPG